LPTVRFEVTVIDSLDSAQQRGFVGSPTILLDGVDPFATPGQPASVSCRLYPGPDGLPTIRDLRQALKRAAFESTRR
jgi:hypothetical protein